MNTTYEKDIYEFLEIERKRIYVLSNAELFDEYIKLLCKDAPLFSEKEVLTLSIVDAQINIRLKDWLKA